MPVQHPHITAVQNYRPLAELIPPHWQTGQMTAADGTKLHYIRSGGTKPALLLLHGIQVSGISWLRTAQALEADYDVIMPDFRGHGQSGSAEKGFSTQLLVEDTLTLIQELGLEKPCVIGHSMGADIAGWVAAAYPVWAVVLIDPALQNIAAAMSINPADPPPWMRAIFEAMAALKTQAHAERMQTGLRLMPPGTPLLSEEDFVTFIEGQTQFDLAVYQHIAHISYLINEPDAIARIACPMLLLTARPGMPGANIEKGLAAFTDNWRSGEHLHFEDSGHFIQAEQFEKFLKVVTQFLERCQQA